MYKKKYKIFISASEQSGDNIGYNIVKILKQNNFDIQIDGIGGHKLSKYFTNQYYSLKDFNTMGIFEIFFSITRFLRMIKKLINLIMNNDYDLIITIDSPDFHYPLIKKLRNHLYDKKIIQIVAPTVWAWREYRAKKFANIYDEIMVLFNFEVSYFSKFGIKTTLIGHPIYYIKKNNIDFDSNKFIAFLPGSRKSELKSLLPYFNIAYRYLLKNNSNSTIFIPTLPHLEKEIFHFVKDWKIKTILTTDKDEINSLYPLINKALVCSGTASLEIAKRNIPQLVIYKLNYFTEFIANFFVKIKYANIINIIENKIIINEITNKRLKDDIFLKEFGILINDKKKNINQIRNINHVINKIELKNDPYKIASERIISYL